MIIYDDVVFLKEHLKLKKSKGWCVISYNGVSLLIGMCEAT